jgi:DNA-binding transcriptional ArsR family regulator
MNVLSDVTGGPTGAPTSEELSDAAEIFGLLADPGRLTLLVTLRTGPANVQTLAAAAGMSESATSHALRLLRARRVVDARRVGRMAFYRLADAHVGTLLDTALAHAEHSELGRPNRTSSSDAVAGQPLRAASR